MPEPAIFELPVSQLAQKQPWERMENEPARWFMRFRNYLKLGPRRSVNAVFEAERAEKAGKRSNKAGESWYGAARRYQWQARADAWDHEQDEQKAALLRQVAARCAFVSRPFRLVQLNTLADGLMRKTEEGCDLATFVTCVRTMQALMHDIAQEVVDWNMPIDASTDAAALDALHKKNERLADIAVERELDQEAEIERLFAQIRFLEEMRGRIRESL